MTARDRRRRLAHLDRLASTTRVDRHALEAAHATALARIAALVDQAEGLAVDVPDPDPVAASIIGRDALAHGIDIHDPAWLADARARIGAYFDHLPPRR